MGISGAAVGALIGRTMTSVMMFAFFWQISRRLVTEEVTS
jgi:Na+-driven multidrug efflux pump